MLDQSLREVKERLLRPVARAVRHVPPMTITLGGFVCGLLACGAAAAGLNGGALVLWLANRVCDGLDGCAARLQGSQCDWGGYADMLGDMVIYALLPVALAWAHPCPSTWHALAALLASFYVNAGSWMYLSAVLEKRSGAAARLTSVAMPRGLIEGTETMAFYVLFLLYPSRLAALFTLMAGLVAATAAGRVAWARQNLERKPTPPAAGENVNQG